MSRALLRLAIVAALAPSLAAPAAGQAILGTFTTTNAQGGTVVLQLAAAGSGRISGTLAGNGTTFQLQGTMGSDAANGTITGPNMAAFFAAQVEGDQLQLVLAPPDAQQQPDMSQAQQIRFTRTAAASSGTAAPAPRGARAAGNPLARGGAAPAERYAGSWTSQEVQLSLTRSGARYTGTLTNSGQRYPVTLRDEGPGLSGSFTANGTSYDVLVKVENGMLYLNTAGTTYMLERGGGAATAQGNPLASRSNGGSAPTQAGRPAGTVRGATAQDRQMIQLLTRNAWCAFSYASGNTYSSTGGASHTERVVLSPDGRASQTSGSERSVQNSTGMAYANNNDGTQGFWKFENGVFYLSPDGTQWQPQQFRMTQNSNGYPIPVVNGKEYMMCQ